MDPKRRSSLLDWVFISASAGLFLCSLLVLTSAPTAALWIVAILVTEWGHYAVIICLLLSALSWQRTPLGRITSGIALLASVLFSWPALQAAKLSRSLPTLCTSAFGEAGANARAMPFRTIDLFRRPATSDVYVTEHVYGSVGKKGLKLDLYRSKHAVGPQPLILMVHGGSWKSGNKSQLPAINRYLAQRYAVASINYRHAPEWSFPAAVEDAIRAFEFLRGSASEFQLDPTRIVLMGRSAGGQIALCAAYSLETPAVRGVISFYAPTDLVLGYEKPSRRWVLDSKKVLEEYLHGTPEENPDAYAAASPVHQVAETTPPTLLIHGELDPVIWPVHSELLAGRLRDAARPHFYLALPWATHGCDANLSGPSGQLSLYVIDRFLAAVL